MNKNTYRLVIHFKLNPALTAITLSMITAGIFVQTNVPYNHSSINLFKWPPTEKHEIISPEWPFKSELCRLMSSHNLICLRFLFWSFYSIFWILLFHFVIWNCNTVHYWEHFLHPLSKSGFILHSLPPIGTYLQQLFTSVPKVAKNVERFDCIFLSLCVM